MTGSFFKKQFIDFSFEEFSKAKGQFERWIITPFFEGYYRGSSDINGVCQILLCNILSAPEFLDAILEDLVIYNSIFPAPIPIGSPRVPQHRRVGGF
jgi:hypothetical protein